MYVITELIKKTRAQIPLSSDEIQYLIRSYTEGSLPDYQMSAWLMAVFFQGLTNQETLSLTEAMIASGEELSFKQISNFKVDKHSTGGVGDKTSLILGPIVAACGFTVPMISGRGLGHTGGTLDKLESIPGFQTQISLLEFARLLKEHNLSFIGQTKEICPADKKIYALRDVTGTVESLPLICASIMSKKIAEGIDGLVLDVKYGSGAFMKSQTQCEELARALIAIAQGRGKRVRALLTNMDQPLGQFAGNALEIKECVEILQGRRSAITDDTRELSLQLSAHMISLADSKKDFSACLQMAHEALESGKAYEKFEQICYAQGGQLALLPRPKHHMTLPAPKSGFIESFDTEAIGMVGVRIKAGRTKTTDLIEPTAGIEFHCKIGDTVRSGDPLFTLYGADTSLLEQANPYLFNAVRISNQQPPRPELIWKVIP